MGAVAETAEANQTSKTSAGETGRVLRHNRPRPDALPFSSQPGLGAAVSCLWQHSHMTELPNGVSRIVKHVAQMAAGYSSGLKWNEEHKLKADMMNMPARWTAITPEELHIACLDAGMSDADASTVSGLQRTRKAGKRFSVRSSYKDFHFMPLIAAAESSLDARGMREW